MGKEYLEYVISESSDISEVFNKYNRASCGGSYRAFKKLVKKWNISLPIPKKIRKNPFEYANKRPLEEILCSNSNVGRTVLRKTIIKNKLLDNTKCSICGNSNMWNEKPMTLILDHINGIRNYNTLDNLRFVCANCNIQLDTTGNRNPNRPNKARKNYCIDCGIKISKTAVRCLKCHNIELRKIERPLIETLKKDIALLGYTGTGRKYGVTDNAIRKWIK